ncbi:serine hydrolase domain-containing protein [Streptomyces sp. NPDC048172]|uniref:serine hydrolase domain-containing protein n=1 Tax=Streptomyces sp. NPDC048172 TaxID=3365505 RepID=UPI0037126EE6
MPLLRPALTALVVFASVLALSVTASSAADGGHAPTHEAMHTAVERDGVPGVLGEADDGAGRWTGSSGVADTRTHRARLPRDRFRIGSLTKPFVATVLLQLEAEGKVRLDDPVGRWLKGLPLGPYGAAFGDQAHVLTIRHLLGHTSGIADYTTVPAFRARNFGPGFLSGRTRTYTPRVLATAALQRPRLFAPGDGWSYSNTNFVLAGMIVQRVTGRPYAEEIERRVIRPLGLRDTSLPGTSARVPGPHGRAYSRLATGYGPHPRTYDVTSLNPSLAGASGEMVSSTRDLTRFARELLTGGLLPPRQLDEMKDTVPAANGDRYGLGLTSRALSCGITVWGHEGTIHGSRSAVFSAEDGTHTAAFNVNADWSSGTRDLVEAEFCA